MTPAIGFHVLKDVVLSPENVRSIIASSLQWQQDVGPMVCVCDEAFYTFLFNNDLEDLYQDISPDLPPFPATEVNPFEMKDATVPDEFAGRWEKIEKVLDGLWAMK
jgi:hypothetical protein